MSNDRQHSWTTYESPLGRLTLTARGGDITALLFPEQMPELDEVGRDPERFSEVTRQLDEYFAGDRQQFDLPLDLSAGTPFQQAVWHQLDEIPFGKTVSYTQLAVRLGRTDLARAVGAAVGRNPLPILVACHRVIGADGSLTGYIGGLERKRALLDCEHQFASGWAGPLAGPASSGSARRVDAERVHPIVHEVQVVGER